MARLCSALAVVEVRFGLFQDDSMRDGTLTLIRSLRWWRLCVTDPARRSTWARKLISCSFLPQTVEEEEDTPEEEAEAVRPLRAR